MSKLGTALAAIEYARCFNLWVKGLLGTPPFGGKAIESGQDFIINQHFKNSAVGYKLYDLDTRTAAGGSQSIETALTGDGLLEMSSVGLDNLTASFKILSTELLPVGTRGVFLSMKQANSGFTPVRPLTKITTANGAGGTRGWDTTAGAPYGTTEGGREHQATLLENYIYFNFGVFTGAIDTGNGVIGYTSSLGSYTPPDRFPAGHFGNAAPNDIAAVAIETSGTLSVLLNNANASFWDYLRGGDYTIRLRQASNTPQSFTIASSEFNGNGRVTLNTADRILVQEILGIGDFIMDILLNFHTQTPTYRIDGCYLDSSGFLNIIFTDEGNTTNQHTNRRHSYVEEWLEDSNLAIIITNEKLGRRYRLVPEQTTYSVLEVGSDARETLRHQITSGSQLSFLAEYFFKAGQEVLLEIGHETGIAVGGSYRLANAGAAQSGQGTDINSMALERYATSQAILFPAPLTEPKWLELSLAISSNEKNNHAINFRPRNYFTEGTNEATPHTNDYAEQGIQIDIIK